MSDQSWEEQFKQFLRKTGDDFRRAGEDIKTEAQKLLDAAMDPDKQQRVRGRLKELGSWARKRAEDVAGGGGRAGNKGAGGVPCPTHDLSGGSAEGCPGGAPAPPTGARKEGKEWTARSAERA